MTSAPVASKQPADGVADGGPAGAAEVQRAGRVGRDELEVDLLAGEASLAPYARPAATIGRDLALGAGLDGDVEEPGPAMSTSAIPSVASSPFCDQLGERRAGWCPAFLASCSATLVA